MAEYIEKTKVLGYLADIQITLAPDGRTPPEDIPLRKAQWDGVEVAIQAIAGFPADDVAKVVRCKNCVHFHGSYMARPSCLLGDGAVRRVADYGFCSFGVDEREANNAKED